MYRYQLCVFVFVWMCCNGNRSLHFTRSFEVYQNHIVKERTRWTQTIVDMRFEWRSPINSSAFWSFQTHNFGIVYRTNPASIPDIMASRCSSIMVSRIHNKFSWISLCFCLVGFDLCIWFTFWLNTTTTKMVCALWAFWGAFKRLSRWRFSGGIVENQIILTQCLRVHYKYSPLPHIHIHTT